MGRKGSEAEAQCHLHINCPPKIILTFNFLLPGRLTAASTTLGHLNWRNISARPDRA